MPHRLTAPHVRHVSVHARARSSSVHAPRIAGVSELISARLRRWVRDRGSAPLLTYYDVGSGERTELSGISLSNWVAKTGNLLVDELMVDAGDQVELALSVGHPGHWVTLVWELA